MDYIALAKLVIEIIKMIMKAIEKDKPQGLTAPTETKAAAQVRLDLAQELDALAARIRQS